MNMQMGLASTDSKIHLLTITCRPNWLQGSLWRHIYTLKKKVLQGFFAVVMVLYRTCLKNLLGPVWFFSGSAVVLWGG